MRKLIVISLLSLISYSQTPATLLAFFNSSTSSVFSSLTPKPSFTSALTVYAAPVTVDTSYKLDAVLSDGTTQTTMLTIKSASFIGHGTDWVQVLAWGLPKDVSLVSLTASPLTIGTSSAITTSK